MIPADIIMGGFALIIFIGYGFLIYYGKRYTQTLNYRQTYKSLVRNGGVLPIGENSKLILIDNKDKPRDEDDEPSSIYTLHFVVDGEVFEEIQVTPYYDGNRIHTHVTIQAPWRKDIVKALRKEQQQNKQNERNKAREKHRAYIERKRKYKQITSKKGV